MIPYTGKNALLITNKIQDARKIKNTTRINWLTFYSNLLVLICQRKYINSKIFLWKRKPSDLFIKITMNWLILLSNLQPIIKQISRTLHLLYIKQWLNHHGLNFGWIFFQLKFLLLSHFILRHWRLYFRRRRPFCSAYRAHFIWRLIVYELS